jgi:hypothetical protein
MELKEFISETIKQIADGITDGNKYIVDQKHGRGVDSSRIKLVKFDVAITSQDQNTTGIGGKITVASMFSAGAA